MRVHTLGRWIGQLAAVAALGMGATVGVAGLAGAGVTYGGDVSTLATDESASDSDSSTDAFEWQ